MSGILLFETLAGINVLNKAFVPAAIILSASAFIIALILLKRKKTALFLVVLSFSLAFVRMFFAVPHVVEAGYYHLSGTVSSSDTGKYFTVSGVKLNGRSHKYQIRLCLKDPDSGRPSLGDTIEAEVIVEKRFTGHSEADLNSLSAGRSITAECENFETVSTGGLKLNRLVLFVRSAIGKRIRELFPDNSPIVTGFLLGDKSQMGYEELSSFRSTGTAHLLSLSGFHVGLISGFFLFVFPKRSRKLRFVFISLFLLCYCAVAAFPPSLVRASIMTAAVLSADLFDRRRDPLSSVSLAAVAILIVSPYELWSVGFRLSFAATLGIIFLSGIGDINSISRAVNRLAQTIAVTFSAFAATSLISARCFGYLSLYSLPANLLALPVFSAAVIMCFAVLVISFPFPAFAGLISWVPDKLIGGAESALSWLAGLPYARLETARPYAVSGFLLLILMFVISPYVLRPIKKRLLASVPVFILFTLSIVLSII